MPEIDVLKEERETLRKEALKLIRLLRGTLQRGEADKALDYRQELDEAMENLQDLHRRIEEEEPGAPDYLQAVSRAHTQVIASHQEAVTKQQELTLARLKKEVEHKFKALTTLTGKIKMTIAQHKKDPSEDLVIALEVGMKRIRKQTTELREKVELADEQLDAEFTERVEALSDLSDELDYEAEVIVTQAQRLALKDREISAHGEGDVSSQVKGEPTGGQALSHPHPVTLLSGVNHPSSVTTSVTTGLLGHSLSTAIPRPGVTACTTVSAPTTGVPYSFLPPPVLTTIQSWPVPAYSSFGSTALVTVPSTVPAFPVGPPYVTMPDVNGVGTTFMQRPEVTVRTSLQPFSALGPVSSPSVPVGLNRHSYSHFVSSTSTFVTRPKVISSVPSPRVMPPQSHVSWSGVNGVESSLGPDSLRPTGTPTVHSDLDPTAPIFTSCPGPPQTNIQIKRRSLPTFSGKRAAWPEFKCMWPRMAEGQIRDPMQLAFALKDSCTGKAAARLEPIYATKEGAYEALWARLCEEYDDPALSVQEALGRLMTLKPVAEENYSGLLKLVDTVESIHSQLNELGQVHAVHAVDVDRVSSALPRSTQVEWLRVNRDLTQEDQVAPFPQFVAFLKNERKAVARLAENQSSQLKEKKSADHRTSSHLGQSKSQDKQERECVMPGHEGHSTEHCRHFKALQRNKKFEALKAAKRCFRCLGPHPCQYTANTCSQDKRHHPLLREVNHGSAQTSMQDDNNTLLKVAQGEGKE